MRFRWAWWYIDADGRPTLGRTHWRGKCLQFEWGSKVTVFFVSRVAPVNPCGCMDGACSQCYDGPVMELPDAEERQP